MKEFCRHHPDRKAVVSCEKHEYGYCEECLDTCSACTDPELYCRHRQQCVIWDNCRGTVKQLIRARKEAEDESSPSA